MFQNRNLRIKKPMNKSLNKLKVSKGGSDKARAFSSFYFCKELLEDGSKIKGSEMEKEGRVHGGESLLEIALKSEKENLFDSENGFVYNPDPLMTRLEDMNLPEGRVHGGNLLALISANEGLKG